MKIVQLISACNRITIKSKQNIKSSFIINFGISYCLHQLQLSLLFFYTSSKEEGSLKYQFCEYSKYHVAFCQSKSFLVVLSLSCCYCCGRVVVCCLIPVVSVVPWIVHVPVAVVWVVSVVVMVVVVVDVTLGTALQWAGFRFRNCQGKDDGEQGEHNEEFGLHFWKFWSLKTC